MDPMLCPAPMDPVPCPIKAPVGPPGEPPGQPATAWLTGPPGPLVYQRRLSLLSRSAARKLGAPAHLPCRLLPRARLARAHGWPSRNQILTQSLPSPSGHPPMAAWRRAAALRLQPLPFRPPMGRCWGGGGGGGGAGGQGLLHESPRPGLAHCAARFCGRTAVEQKPTLTRR
jgi:hypothetical protein